MVESENGNVELELSGTKGKGLSLKAKGAGIIILLCISIGGIVFLSYIALTTKSDNGGFFIAPILLLSYISYSLMAIMGTMFTGQVWEVRNPDE